MKLRLSKRKAQAKSEINLIRQQGDIPAVLYSKGKENTLISVSGADFNALLRKTQQGQLPTTVVSLEGEGVSVKAIVKDIQYEPTTYDVIHLDFMELHQETPITLNVPIRCTGMGECEGIKLGGFLRQVIRHVKVSCLPKDMPKEFVLDVADLGIKQSKRVKDMTMPHGVTPEAPLNEVVVVIAKR